MKKYIILVYSGDRTFLLGRHDIVVSTFDATMKLSDVPDAGFSSRHS